MSWSLSFPNGPTNDLLLKSSDEVQFAVHKLILSTASPVFKDMLVVAHQPQPAEPVSLTEDSVVLEKLLNFIYHRENPPFATLDDILPTLRAAHKYRVRSAVQVLLQHIIKPPASATLAKSINRWCAGTLLSSDSLRVYAVARQLGLHDLELAAREEWFNGEPWEMDPQACPDLEEMPYGWYRDLLKARAQRRAWFENQDWDMDFYVDYPHPDDEWGIPEPVKVDDPYDVGKMQKELLGYPSLRRIRTIMGNIHGYFQKTAILGALDLLHGLTHDFVQSFPEANVQTSYLGGETG